MRPAATFAQQARAMLAAEFSSGAPELVEQAAAISQIAFQDPERAARNLATVLQRVPKGVGETLPTLLRESPDPDAALNLFERLCGEDGQEAVRLMERHRFLVHYALTVFGHSQFLGETLIRNPDLFHALVRGKNLGLSYSREDFEESLARFRSRSLETDAALLLARFRKREYVRIMLRDVLGIATLAETTAEISALSDVLIEEALRECDAALRNRLGPPQHTDANGRTVETPFAVLSLGKLGGNELNYSSDVDLLFLHGDGEPEKPRATSNREYFIRLGQAVTELLSRATPEGAVFRIDLRLRPQGREGEPAVSLGAALRYYNHTARDWELQALIKVRHSAGRQALAREFIRAVQPGVYKGPLNFSAIETALDTREKIRAHRLRSVVRTGAVDVKVDRGGIRDIEFLVQCLQRVYGGAEPWLRSGGTLFSLHKLHDKGHLSGKDFHDLNSGYEFLRKVEHRLQLRRGQQTHRLPETEQDRRVLERAVLGPREAEDGPRIGEAVAERMAAVAEIYQRIIHSEQEQKHKEEPGGGFQLRSAPAEFGRELSYDQVLHRLAVDSPALHEIASRRELSSHARRNLHRFLSAAFTSSERYAAVTRNPRSVEDALRLFSVSDYLTEILIRHPEEISTISELGERAPTQPKGRLFGSEEFEGVGARDGVLEHLRHSGAEYGEKLALLRRRFRHRMFACGARDLLEFRPVHESLAEMTALADDVLAAAAAIVQVPPGFSVLALGRLGTREFDLASDADLIFLREEELAMTEAQKAAEQMVEALAAYTREGTIFAVDPRLRPHGTQGELVITPEQLGSYFSSEAHPWEALTYTKLRAVAGCHAVAGKTWDAVVKELPRFAEDPGFAASVREMRARLEKSENGESNFKTVAGGFYDIDFIVSYLVVKHGTPDVRGPIRHKLQALAAQDRLTDNDCATLESAVELYRTLEHVIRLVTGRARKSLPALEHAREAVERLTGRLLGRDFPEGLEPEMERNYGKVREIYERLLQ